MAGFGTWHSSSEMRDFYDLVFAYSETVAAEVSKPQFVQVSNANWLGSSVGCLNTNPSLPDQVWTAFKDNEEHKVSCSSYLHSNLLMCFDGRIGFSIQL